MEGRNLWVLTTDDIRKAFDRVRLDSVVADCRRDVECTRTQELVEVILRGR